MLLRFPADLCTDRGRSVHAPLPDWSQTLRGEPAEIYLRWERDLKPGGFHLAARVLDFPGGFPGDIGLFLVWRESRLMPAPPRAVKRMHEPILVINAGSSSIKFSVFETGADRSLSPAAHGRSRECRDLPDDRRPPARGGQKMICPAAQRPPGSSSQWTPSWRKPDSNSWSRFEKSRPYKRTTRSPSRLAAESGTTR